MDHENTVYDQPSENAPQFTSRLGFYLAAVGSAVGIGNIWGFPAQTADNGGAAFVLIYLCFSFLLAWPMLVAELVIGRYGRSDPVSTLESVSNRSFCKFLGKLTGWASTITVLLIYTFYAIISGWIICFGLAPVAVALGLDSLAASLTSFNPLPTMIAAGAFMAMVAAIVSGGVADGIEKWCSRLMPMLVLLILLLIVFTMTQEGAQDGLRYFVLPDFSKLLSKDLLISALGQSFFSMSLGVGIMVVYGAYLTRDSNIPVMAASVAVTDTLVAVMAGLLIIPGMYVALNHGIDIYTAEGALKSADKLVFDVLPQLFLQFGPLGILLSLAFFLLLTITALTSAVSILEVPVAVCQRRHLARRNASSWLISLITFGVSVCVMIWFDVLFDFVVNLTTRYAMPLLSLVVCIYAAWIWSRDQKLRELQKGYPDVEHSLFWKIWPWYIRFFCPFMVMVLIFFTF
ncbi:MULTISPECIES: sodium-dependent transporter [unclassified Endozoicomonas]|uniref:sodium-dependent transporter n=1 Tax=unclassified Endozoicomonas TaxID=2644528 RepID=UPI002148D6E9|nr:MULTISPECIES: sodium-dependent transporter [unclassified Endozoicomonas]